MTGPDHGGLAAWYATAFAVWWAGGRPRRITPERSLEDCEVGALIIGGGADVSPELYGEPAEAAPREAVTKSSRHWTRRLATALLFPLFFCCGGY